MGMREEFEAWVSGRKVVIRHGAGLNQNSDGTYSDYRINDRWLAWQASRAALVVTLPDRDPLDAATHWTMHDLCAQALTDAGVSYK